jgi:hypothetical protein
MSGTPRLHLPSEPDRALWWGRVMESATLDEVIEKEDGIAPWLWERWRVLESAGLDRPHRSTAGVRLTAIRAARLRR